MATVSINDEQVFHKIKTEISLHLPPVCLTDLDGGIKNYLTTNFLLKYKEIFNGVPICFNKVDYSTDNCELLYENPFIHLQVSVEFIVFVPHKGSVLRCKVNKQSEDHVGGLVFGTFNVSIAAQELVEYGYEWNEDIGAWCYQNEVIQNDSEIEFLVDRIKHGHGVLVIYGRFAAGSH